jgi:hypothetical protein
MQLLQDFCNDVRLYVSFHPFIVVTHQNLPSTNKSKFHEKWINPL